MPKRKPILFDAMGKPISSKTVKIVVPGAERKIIAPKPGRERVSRGQLVLPNAEIVIVSMPLPGPKLVAGAGAKAGRKPRIEIPSTDIVRGVMAAGTARILEAQDTALNEAHNVFLKLMKLRNWQTGKAIKLLWGTKLFRRNTQVGAIGGRQALVVKGIERDFRKMPVKELRRLFADMIIDEYFASKKRKQALQAHLERDAEKLAKATEKRKR